MEMTPEQAWKELNERKTEEFNHPPGGSPCPVCNGSGHLMTDWSTPEHYNGNLIICPHCGQSIEQDNTARKGGAPARKGEFADPYDWQKKLHRQAATFAKNPEGFFYIGGQTATGKTHLCNLIFYAISDNGSSGLVYEHWKSLSRRLSNDRAGTLMETMKGCNVLLLDGFLDVLSSKGTPSVTELDKAFEIVDARSEAGKVTIISSHYTPKELESTSSQIASRIEQATGDGEYFLSVPDGKEDRWRAKRKDTRNNARW